MTETSPPPLTLVPNDYEDPYAGIPSIVDELDATPTPTTRVTQVTHVIEPEKTGTAADRFIDGATFVLDAPTDVPAIWGHNTDILWAEGEALMICGGNGVGKTTLGNQLLRARLGLGINGDDRVLGLPVEPGKKRVLYLAMDRPNQIRRAMRRVFHPDERDVLAEALIVWPGPPIADMAQNTSLLAQMCESADADTVVIDSLKDAAVGLSGDETGAGWNRARQTALSAGVEVLELHHLVKRNANGGEPDSIADIYGSAWLTSGAGSVILLAGAPGDPLVKFRHLKQPVDEVGPFNVVHDHDAGVSSIQVGTDALEILRAEGLQGLTAKRLAEVAAGGGSVRPAEVEKSRRKLDRLVKDGLANKVETVPGAPMTYFARASHALEERGL